MFNIHTRRGIFSKIFLALLAFCSQNINAQISQNQNYVVSYQIKKAGVITDNDLSTVSSDIWSVQTDIHYADGLGRPLQIVQTKGNPGGTKDLVQLFSYDQFGRENIKYKTYAPSSTTYGSYRSNAVNEIATFFNPSGNINTTVTQQSNGIVNTAYPYSLAVYEQSPLNRVVEQGYSGKDWQPQATSPLGHTKKISYGTNNEIAFADTTNCMRVTYYSASINADNSRSLVRGNGTVDYYLANQLFVTVTKNEGWISGKGGIIEEFKDKDGRVVLSRTFNYDVSTNKLQTLSTYYVYDKIGNLCFILPPKSNADAVLPNADFLDKLCYQYQYDLKNRRVESKLPGKGSEFTIYNKLDQIVETQDAVQRAKSPQQASFTKYDVYGRVVMTGVFNVANAPDGSSPTRISMQNDVDAQTIFWESRLNVGTAGTTDYTAETKPKTDFTALVINYYDSYNAIPGRPGNYTPSTYSKMTNDKLTATRAAILNTPTSLLMTVIYYNDNGLETTRYQQHFKGGQYTIRNYDEINTTYDFEGRATTTKRKHYIYDAAQTAAQLKFTLTKRFIYDHRGRRIKTWQQITNSNGTADLTPDARVLLSKIDYNDVGQKWKKNLHSTDSLNYMQTITYAYNERGWLRTANAPLFSEELRYNTGSKKFYNGNIAYQFWGAASNLNKHYTYDYDQQNRLTSGTSYLDGGTLANNETGITYDLNGNILTLKRYAASTLIDNLSYVYQANSNTLLSLTDATSSDQGQKHGTTNYQYNENGSLKIDDSKGITGITYNVLNLPQSITGINTQYIYDAFGSKLRRLISGVATEYVNSIQYSGTTMDFIQTEEGRAIPKDATGYNYEYSLTDHLGSSRINFDTGTGTARLVQSDDYYPFGLEISNAINGTKNEYLYNKKELQENTKAYDFGARFYDPNIARWSHIDPKAELYFNITPYAYAANTPTNAIDPDGNLVIFINGQTSGDDLGTPSYWGGFDRAVQRHFNDYNSSYENHLFNAGASYDKNMKGAMNGALYIDGSLGGWWGNTGKWVYSSQWNLNVDERIVAGYNHKDIDIGDIISSLQRTNGVITESLRIVAHSLGAAYARGLIAAIVEYARTHPAECRGLNITEYDFAAFQQNSLPAPDPGVTLYQYDNVNDNVVGGIVGRSNNSHHAPQKGRDEKHSNDNVNPKGGHSIQDFLSAVSKLATGNYRYQDGKFVSIP